MPWHPLHGVRVLDLSRLLPGPFMTQLLADLGADVVKVEEPTVGDYARWIGPDVDGAGYAFSAVNRGKRSVALDLKAEGGAAALLTLAARADVLVESFRPGVMDRLGLGDEALARANPRLVRVSLVGYPPGEWRGDPNHDLNAQALSGLLAAQGPPGSPMAGAAQVADVGGALYAAVATLAALRERDATGRGRRVEVALSDAALAFATALLARAEAEGAAADAARDLQGDLACYRVYACADGRHVALAALEPKFWKRFVAATGRDDLADRHPGRDMATHAALEALFRAGARDAWVARLRAAGVPATPVLA
ncbi:MAG TPA: CaiB/BaiF CoA-transferase family protein, partial [Candidatus Thermoplasmatota archaeon]|nr:CaiB/BaiF CoA-transferase family protein [Candidatus Thermoplasmatota archaeon]